MKVRRHKYSVAEQVAREQSKHPMKPKGCNGWWSEADKALLHGAARCTVHDPIETP
jgi:hypothetical protein